MNLLRNPSRTKTVASVAAIFLLGTLVTAAFASRPSYAASQAAAGVVIPLYTYPDSSWTAIAQTAAAYPNVPIIAVVNPSSGPGSSMDPNYLANIQSLQSAGVKVLGYVATGYATSSYSAISNVESQVSDYSSWYHVNGIFFDEMSNTPGYENYYSTLNSFVKSIGMTYTMGNPGASVPSSYIGTLDDLVIYENAGYPSMSYITYPGYPSSDFSLIAYGVSYDSSFVTNAAGLVGYMYLDDQSGSDPYATLSSYFAQTVSTLATTASTTTTTTSSSGVNTSSLTVSSTDTSGAAVAGLWTVLFDQTGTNQLSSGYTPTTFTLDNGQPYMVQADGYGSCSFAYWKDNGNGNNLRAVTITANTDLDAVYDCGSTTTSTTTTTTSTATTTQTTTTTSSTGSAGGTTITVKSASLGGVGFTGAPATVKSSRGKTLASGPTTLVFAAKAGSRYSVCASNYQSYVFSHWSDGSTSLCETVTPTSSITLTAYFGGGTSTLSVTSVGATGGLITGLWTVLFDQTGTTQLATGFTPTTFAAKSGETYQLEAGSYGSCNFAYWEDSGSTSNLRTVVVTSDINLVAVYSC